MVGASVGAKVGVAVGDWQKVEVVAGAAPPPEVSISSVPNSPEVLTWVDAPAASWKLFVAMGVPLSSKVQLPALVISAPKLVIVKVPWAAGVQEDERAMTGTPVCACGAASTFTGAIAFTCTGDTA
jgi:hypothetical protein